MTDGAWVACTCCFSSFCATEAGDEIAAGTKAVGSLLKSFAIVFAGVPQVSVASLSIGLGSMIGLTGNRIILLTHSGQSDLPVCNVRVADSLLYPASVNACLFEGSLHLRGLLLK